MGRPVDLVTLKALLTPSALERLDHEGHRFCATRACPVVYFGPVSVFAREDLAVPVFQKEAEGDRLVCYCLGIGEAEVRRRPPEARRGPSARERIEQLVRAGRCACELRNPQGRCCLGNVDELQRVSGARSRIRGRKEKASDA